MPSEKKNQEKPAVDVNAMIDQLVANAQKALEEYMKQIGRASCRERV